MTVLSLFTLHSLNVLVGGGHTAVQYITPTTSGFGIPYWNIWLLMITAENNRGEHTLCIVFNEDHRQKEQFVLYFFI